MNTHKMSILGLIALILTLVFTACEQPTDDPPAPTLTGIFAAYNGAAVSQNTPLNNLKANLTVMALYSDSTGKTLAPTDYALSGTLAIGTSAIIVTYEGKTATFTVTVSNKTLTGITLNTASVKKAYSQNEQLDLYGLLVTANYSDSSSVPVTGYTSSPVNGATLSTSGQITVTVSYTEGELTETAGFIVNVGGPAHVHQWGAWVTITPATETEDGEETRTCATCGEEETQPIVAFNHVHQWGGWTQTRVPTEIQDGEETRICSLNAAHQETRTLYATGTAGLSYTLIRFGGAYSVSKGTATSASTIHIPAYHRPNADSDYLPVMEIGKDTDSESSNAFGGIRYSSAYTVPNTTLTAVTFAENSQLGTIGRYAFWNCTSLTSVNIPASVAVIDRYAFSDCTSLTSVNIPEGVRDIYENAFQNCTSLASVNIPASVTYSNFAFYGCTSLTSVTFGEGVTSILSGMFSGCTGLTNITIPASVTCIANDAFRGCTGLTNITIPASVTSIYNSAFRGCTGLTNITIPAGVTSIDSHTFSDCTSLARITIPASVTSIGYGAFSGCTSLANITIPEGIAYIDSFAFYNCTSLTSINIPASVTSVGNNAFTGCTSLAGITVAANNTTYASQDGILYNKAKTQFILIPPNLSGNVTIPEGITSIGNEAFRSRTSLTGITIPASVTSIGQSAFSGCTSLTSIIIPAGVINGNAFEGCTSLTSVTIGEGVTSIGNNAFWNCTSLASVTIPAGVINSTAFEGCTSLASVTIGEGVTSIIGNYPFQGCTSLTAITVAANNTTYASQDGILYNKAKTQFIIIPQALSGNVTIPEGITTIYANAFNGCTGLTSVTIGEGVTSIYNDTFQGCASLTAITVAANNTTYASQDGILYNKAKTRFILIPSNLSGNVTIPVGVTSIDDNAFSGCTGLTGVTIPTSVTSIGQSAFSDCTGLTSVTCLPTTPPTLGTGVFTSAPTSLAIKVPSASVTAYRNATNWSAYASRISAL